MRIEEIMTRTVRAVSPGLDAETAWQEMQAARIHHLVVVENNDIVGIVSERDLGSERGAGLREGKRVADLMTPSVIFAWHETTIRRAANLMRGQTIGCLPVMDGKTLVGIVTTTDLLDLIGRGAERPTAESTRWVLRGRGPRRPAIRRAIKRSGSPPT
jgi:CBS domain-containing protein